jgi:hypothetical protein
MTAKELRQWEKKFYQALKAAVKARKIKLSAERDIYKKADPYFYSAFYSIAGVEDGKVDITLHISIKYHRFDELQHGILRPDALLHFTDKLRANSGALCPAGLPDVTQSFAYDGSEEAMPKLCEDLLDFLKAYCSDFLAMVEREYGDLDGYYIAHKEEMPRLAGLAYLDRGEPEKAIECFSSKKMDGENSLWSVDINTEEQYRRAQENGTEIYVTKYGTSIYRSRKEQFADYAVALKNGLEWNYDRAMYGLLKKERSI